MNKNEKTSIRKYDSTAIGWRYIMPIITGNCRRTGKIGTIGRISSDSRGKVKIYIFGGNRFEGE